MREADFDLAAYVQQVLALAKENLSRDGTLLPVVFLVTPQQVLVAPVLFEGADEKQQAYRGVVDKARELGALAIITLNDARYTPNAADKETYYDGKLAEEDAPECILLTVSGPGLTNWFLRLPYDRRPEGIRYGELLETSGGSLGLLENWADDGAQPS